MSESLFGDPLECIPDEWMYGYCQEMAHMCWNNNKKARCGVGELDTEKGDG